MSNTINVESVTDGSSTRIIQVFDPSTEEQIAEVIDSDQKAVDAAVGRARETFESGVWRKQPAIHRADVLFRAAAIVRERTDELAAIEARDNGMNAMAARHIIAVAYDMLMYYAGWVGKIHGESSSLVSDGLLGEFESFHTFTQLEPVGVVGLIVPWNGPFFVAMLKVAPALAAGCSAVLKPAEETPLSALKLEEIFREAGLPDGVLNVVTGYGETTGAALTAHPDVDKISFTGSTEVGRLIVKAAAGNLKRLTLELGGKSPLIMFDDADLDKAIMGAGMGLLAGSGQNCSCTSRIYVQRGIYDRVVDGLAAFAKMLPMGGSDDPSSVLGPLISAKQRERVAGIVDDGVAAGAQVVTGGKPMDRRGYFYEATIVTGTTPDMRLIREEIFGPVGSVIPFDDEDEVIAAANATDYGLAGSIWTCRSDPTRSGTCHARGVSTRSASRRPGHPIPL
ncbi:aldehyde dehydrogenase family protein, partial [Nocardia sp. NPDC003648]